MRMSELFENDDKKLAAFHKSLGNAIKGRISQIHADTAIQQAKNPDQWRFKKGDQVYSKSTGNIYTITNLYYDSKRNRAMYFYSTDNGEGRGSLIADLANKSLIKINESHNSDVDNNTSEGWSEKYKRSINCSNPRGFSQRAHCNGKKKKNEDATAGATSSASIATVVNPGMTNKGKATAAGKPGKMANKGPKQMSPKKQSPSDNALDSNAGLMTGTPIKR